ncbi:Myotubularin- protein 6 [Didymella heteroderae]|uniref:Myotubularin- protein 6 n=1 Tax=Didymella heteroderae TaxID=1769908 RepID=A0A9P4WJX2_9PLEO|nr:Myotubularin- protein 6 [Didymella heteroderae]
MPPVGAAIGPVGVAELGVRIGVGVLELKLDELGVTKAVEEKKDDELLDEIGVGEADEESRVLLDEKKLLLKELALIDAEVTAGVEELLEDVKVTVDVEVLIADGAELLIESDAELLAERNNEPLAEEDAEILAEEDVELLMGDEVELETDEETEMLAEDEAALLAENEVELTVELIVDNTLEELLALRSSLNSVKPLGPPHISVEFALQGMLQRLSVTGKELAFSTFPQ